MPNFFNKYPYTDFHELNLDFVLKELKNIMEQMDTFIALNTISFADPLAWDITSVYTKNTIVLDTNGNAFLSLKEIPAGIDISNADYWLEIFDFTEYVTKSNKNLTVNFEYDTDTATAAYSVNEWLIWNEVLYRVTAAINPGDSLAEGVNIEHFTVEDFLNDFITTVNQTIIQYKNDIDASELLYKNQLSQTIANTTASLQAQLDAAIAGVTVDSEVINARIGADGVTYSTLGEADRTQFGRLNEQEAEINAIQEKTSVINLYDPDDADVETGGYYNAGYIWIANANFMETGYIKVSAGHSYRFSTWADDINAPVHTFDENKTRIGYINPATNTGYIIIPAGVAYIRSPLDIINRYTAAFYKTAMQLPAYGYGKGLLFGHDGLIDNKYRLGQMGECLYNQMIYTGALSPDSIDAGWMKTDGVVYNSPAGGIIHKFSYDPLKDYYLDGTGTMSPVGWCYVWFVANGNMIGYVAATSNPQTFTNYKLNVPLNADEIWLSANQMTLKGTSYADIGLIPGNQWSGKTWYGYGTSITNTNAEGKYPIYLAQMSNMTFVNKGISGGGIGNLGAYSTGQVYSAICNTTDGKLAADLITLETGANDTAAGVPLGTIYDTGTATLAGCLNDCLRYLQANTTAQIVVFCSPSTTTAPNATDKYYEWAMMIEQICKLNRVHFVNSDNNMGYAKLTGADGSLYVSDSIHQTNLGGYIMAQNIWSQLKDIPLFYTSMP